MMRVKTFLSLNVSVVFCCKTQIVSPNEKLHGLAHEDLTLKKFNQMLFQVLTLT